MMNNPFLTYGYAGPEYFCDRQEETRRLTSLLVNGNHVALISPRRMGKTGLLNHCFAQRALSENYYTFVIDVYATKSLAEFTYVFGKEILRVLKSKGRQAWEKFLQAVGSFRTGISLDEFGKPSWNLEMGDIKTPEITLDEIFEYLTKADKPCLIAIDEFQSIASYKEKTVEALLRTYIQRCTNAWFVFSGSKRTMMSEIFNSPSRPFYQSATMMSLKPIPLSSYSDFIQEHFRKSHKAISRELIRMVYENFEGTTWYVQKMANEFYALTDEGGTCGKDEYEATIQRIVNENEDAYQDLMCRLSSRQKAVLIAVNKSGPTMQVTSSSFIKTNKLPSSSSVQKALEALIEKDIVTNNLGTYRVYDYFFHIWLLKKYGHYDGWI